jgi:glycosyltransferase involved in cell wall biosynthesis
MTDMRMAQFEAKRPQVAVLLPVFNGARYLRASIESVLGQSFGSFEFLICDDASTDESFTMLQEYKDARIRLSRHGSNRGLFATLNDLIRQSSAPLVHLWSQDDVMLADCLKRHLEFHEEHREVVMSYSAVYVIDDNGWVIEQAGGTATPEVISPRLAAQMMYYYGSIPGNIANVALTREALLGSGLFREDLKVSGDFEMWVRLTRSHPIGFIRRPLIRLRRHSGQFSRRRDSELAFIRENRAIIDELLERLPPEQQRTARQYLVRFYHRSYAHGAVRSVLRGDLRLAASILRELRERDALARAFVFWLITGNGRWWPRVHGPRLDEMAR